MLIGREIEIAQLWNLLDRVRGCSGTALALEGEPGAGKTALLEHVAGQAEGLTILTARGVASESQLAFSGLLELLRPALAQVPELPTPQAAALAAAFALGPPVAGDRFAVYAATLGLLSRIAQQGPVLVIVDDVHWLDPASLEAVRFAARRVGDERLGFLLATRAGAVDTSGLPVLEVGGLARDASLALLPEGTATPVADEILRATAGNALALVEIPTLLSAAQLEGREPLDDPLSAGPRTQRAFLSRVEGLAPATRTALLLAAASGVRAVDTVLRGLIACGLDATALEAAESAGLLSITAGTLEFRHPLVRSAVYHGAPASERRAAHRALASALQGSGETHAVVRRSWHLAAASLGPDETVAVQLDAAADDARERTGYAEAATAYERATELTPAGDDRARRSLRAADAWHMAGRSERAVDLIERALPGVEDPLLRAKLHHARGRIDMWRGPAREAKDRLVSEAARIEPVAPALAAHMLADAVTGCVVAGPMDEAVRIGRRAHAAALRLGGEVELLAALQLGKALILSGEHEGDALVLRYEALLRDGEPLAWATELAHCLPALMTIEAFDRARVLLERLVPAARSAGAFGLLAYCLGAQAELGMRTGRWATAYADGIEAVALARAAGQRGQLSSNLARLAWLEAAQGREAAARADASEALELAAAFGFHSSTLFADAALLALDLCGGRFEAAADRRIERHDLGLEEPNRLLWPPDQIEALVRTGRLDEAEAALTELAERTQRPMAMAALYRCRGLLADDAGYTEAFQAALGWHERSATPFERARTELCFGERLRRSRRRSEARAQLRSAVATFDRLGARPWAERARSELRASGETARKRTPTTAERLTAQELQVARVVAEGATTREAAAALFVSPKTIDSHLNSAYRKLGVHSRSELTRRLLGGEAALGPAVLAPWPAGVENAANRLTPQEREVARIVAQGASNREAASALFVAEKTVEFHLSNTYRKLGVHSRAELARLLE